MDAQEPWFQWNLALRDLRPAIQRGFAAAPSRNSISLGFISASRFGAGSDPDTVQYFYDPVTQRLTFEYGDKLDVVASAPQEILNKLMRFAVPKLPTSWTITHGLLFEDLDHQLRDVLDDNPHTDISRGQAIRKVDGMAVQWVYLYNDKRLVTLKDNRLVTMFGVEHKDASILLALIAIHEGGQAPASSCSPPLLDDVAYLFAPPQAFRPSRVKPQETFPHIPTNVLARQLPPREATATMRKQVKSWGTFPLSSDAQQIGAILSPKADIYGRFWLLDVWMRPDVDVVYSGYLTLMGDPTRKIQGDSYLERSHIETYLRIHTPNGVVVKKAGLGFCLYAGTALGAHIVSGGKLQGVHSEEGRSPKADVAWKSFVKSGLASIKLGDYSRRHVEVCQPLDKAAFRKTHPDVKLLSDKVCQDLEVQARLRYEFIPYQAVLESGLMVAARGFRNLQRPPLDLLACCYMAPNEKRMVDVVKTLLGGGDEELAIAYASRIDVYPHVQRNALVRSLLGGMPGRGTLRGLGSNAGGLVLPELSASTKAHLANFADIDAADDGE